MATLFDSRGHVPAGILRLVAIGESNVAIYPAIGGYGVEDIMIYLGEFSPHPLAGRASDTQLTRNTTSSIDSEFLLHTSNCHCKLDLKAAAHSNFE